MDKKEEKFWLPMVLFFLVFIPVLFVYWVSADKEIVCSQEYTEKKKSFVEQCSVYDSVHLCNKKAQELWCEEVLPWEK